MFDLQTGGVVSGGQIDAYSKAFGIAATQDNVVRMTRMICKARAVACREGTARLPVGDEAMAGWSDDALVDDAPFAFGDLCGALPNRWGRTRDEQARHRRQPCASRHHGSR